MIPILCRVVLFKAETISPTLTNDFLERGQNPQQVGARIESYYRSLVQSFSVSQLHRQPPYLHLWRWCPLELCRHCMQPCIAALLLYHADPQTEEPWSSARMPAVLGQKPSIFTFALAVTFSSMPSTCVHKVY